MVEPKGKRFASTATKGAHQRFYIVHLENIRVTTRQEKPNQACTNKKKPAHVYKQNKLEYALPCKGPSMTTTQDVLKASQILHERSGRLFKKVRLTISNQ